MKKIFFLVLFFFFLQNIVVAQRKAKSFAIKSGHIEYKLTGNTIGTRSLWWDEYGYKSRMEEKSVTTIKMLGIKNEDKRHMLTVMVGGQFWTADLIKKTGQKGKIDFYKDVLKFTEGLTEAEIKKLEDDILNSFGGKRLGTGMVLGKECEIISIMGAKSWIYKGLMLKSEVKMMGIENNEIAVSFDKNINISTSKFKYLPNIEYEDISKYQQEMFGDLEIELDEEDKEDIKSTRVKYSFDKFKEVVSDFKYDNYKRVMVISQNGQHMATFMKGFNNTLVVVASSVQDADDKYSGVFEKFTYKGKTCRYGKVDDESGTILMITYPRYEMNIVIVSGVHKSKDELLKINDNLNF